MTELSVPQITESNQSRENSDTRLTEIPLHGEVEEQRKKSTTYIIDEGERWETMLLGSKKKNQQDAVMSGTIANEELDEPRDELRTAINARESLDALPRPAGEQEKLGRADGNNRIGRNEEVSRNRKPKKREAPKSTSPQLAKRSARDAVFRLRQRIELLPRGTVREPLRLALNAAIALKEHHARTLVPS
ncbi:hypothetical protein GQ600_26211 [Phytophthora cactorum]|nr:hypothetical protein GQ600_26211 [Phytophthora cactorum]